MKQMTTAAFAKATFGTLDEPIEVRRYTKVVGIYYPAGYDPSPLPEVLNLVLDAGLTQVAAQKRVDDLEDEIRRLKKLLSERGIASDKVHVWEPEVKVAANRREDPFSGLSKQDREFFERKLGKKK